MIQLTKAALGAAVAASVVSVADAVLRATSDSVPPWDPKGANLWALAAFGVLLAATFLLLAAVLVAAADVIDGGRRVLRWTRRALAVALVVLAVDGSVASILEDSAVLGAVAGIAFLAMFLLGAGLGSALLRRPGLRAPAALMASTVPVIGLTFAVEAVAPGWGHPAYAEAVLYVGIALLGLAAVPETVPGTSRPAVAGPQEPSFPAPSAALPASSRATGTRKGEQET